MQLRKANFRKIKDFTRSVKFCSLGLNLSSLDFLSNAIHTEMSRWKKEKTNLPLNTFYICSNEGETICFLSGQSVSITSACVSCALCYHPADNKDKIIPRGWWRHDPPPHKRHYDGDEGWAL